MPDPPTPTGTAGADLLQLELSEPSSDAPGGRPAEQPADLPTPMASHSADDPLSCANTPGPGSAGEHLLQAAYGTTDRAARFYRDQVLDHLNPQMTEFTERMEMAFVATSDASGECDCSLRAGPAGFIHVLNEKTLAYPEYRGNGVLASLGNISENAHVAVLMVDFVTDLIGLHVNGTASIVEDVVLRGEYPALPVDGERGRTPERWVLVHVVEAYVHCRKHIPRMMPVDRVRGWGTDDPLPKGGDYFGAKAAQRVTQLVGDVVPS
jgi:predicted pyridoxine 5'-phosphate oxidase superfamily flavin-nucleotide-binding protein